MSQGNEIIVVTGQARSGTTMMMRMLEAGGVSLYYDDSKPITFMEDGITYLNHNRILREVNKVKGFAKGDTGWIGDCQGKAVKILMPMPTDFPMEYRYRFIYMDRKWVHMVKSQQKYMKRIEKGYPERGDLLGHVKGVKSKALAKLRRYDGGILQISFENTLKSAKSVSLQLAHFLGMELDVDAMAAAVVERPAYCLDYMMEEEIYNN